MEPIKDTNLGDLVSQASSELLAELRTEGVSQIKKLFSKSFVLQREVIQDENKLSKKKESLKKAQDTLEKIKSGDWSSLKYENSDNGQ